ncbi:MAG: flagellar M-ring protein FliF [Deltaproteobacteria bacterium]|nr:flagellar M-ring protein FliF [Deltaproteobacteria bacterium]
MLEKYKEKLSRAREYYHEMNQSRKIIALGLMAAVIAAVVVILLMANKTEYDILYTGLSQDDAGAVVAKLRERKTPYELDGNGSTIRIPKEAIQETRLYLATEGLPTGGSIGMEMFNKTRIGETEFQQHLNFQRALQGELERTILKFPEIQQVRVHLSIPKESLFIEQSKEPSASVVVKLQIGKFLTKSQLAGIVHLVASSVEGLKHQNITIVDTSGGILYSKEENEGLLSATQIQYQKNTEQGLTERLTSMLERVVGPGKAMARVNVQLNLQQTNTHEEIFDPDRSAVRSEQRLVEKNQGQSKNASGVPNATYELGTGNRQQTGQSGQSETYEKSEETTNYEITRINRQTTTQGGEIKKLSVAVMVDGTYPETTKDGNTVKTFVPRPANELAQIEELVKKAVGYDESRGDQVTVSSVSFYSTDTSEKKWYYMPIELLIQFGKPLFNIVLIVLFFIFIVRPIMSWLQRGDQAAAPAPVEHPPMTAIPSPEEQAALDAAEAAKLTPLSESSEPSSPQLIKGQLTRDQIMALFQENPERAVNVIRSWIEQR